MRGKGVDVRVEGLRIDSGCPGTQVRGLHDAGTAACRNRSAGQREPTAEVGRLSVLTAAALDRVASHDAHDLATDDPLAQLGVDRVVVQC